MSRTLRRRTAASIEMQTLEDRRMLAAFGTPWPDARDLTISFPSDNVRVGSYENNIAETLDPLTSRDQWQELALRAYQTWAINADINVGLRNDYDVPFGTPGMTTGDPRFGEFRIGAFPQQGLLASSVPFQAVAGTYSGDLLLNSNEQLQFHDWNDGVAPDPDSLGPLDRDLFSVLLHEVGNTLGIEDNSLDWSVMFHQYTVPKGMLSAEDIASVQALYGARSDPYESVDNGQLHIATVIPNIAGFDPTTDVIRTRGSLAESNDVDYHKIIPLAGHDSATIRLRASGISLLKSRLDIVDELDNVLASSSSASVFDNDNVLQISGLASHSSIYLRVSADDPSDVYSVGDYEIEVDYRSAAVQAADPVVGGHDSGPESLFASFALEDDELGLNDTIGNATQLNPTEYVSDDRYEVHSSVSAASDIDLWKFTAPGTIDGRLIAHVSGVGLDSPDVRIQVLDSDGNQAGTAARLRPDGTFTVEVAQPVSGADYFMRVAVDPSSAVDVGNYVATVEFESPSTQMNDLVSDQVSDDGDNFVRWTAGKTKLYRFELSAGDAESDQAVRLTIYDAHTKEVRLIAVTQAGVTRGALAWLQQGDYILRFTAISRTGLPVDGITYSLTADGISDDQDDDDDDDDGNYYYDSGYYGSGYYGSGYYGYWYNGYYYYY